MRITDAHNRSIVPLGYSIQHTHQTGVGDERANFRFVNRRFASGLETFYASGR